ncbi:very-long-chain (3R)-3-hydroxyacyl-CoA dehydratase PASTICCINO 2B isoform X1 [Triticum aestivum]|uniref:very-long-chain (3R)-3-hydroxyacyl-CoA dehydratase PASTICCINO 2B isoform X1 n=1 Tax=Triticum aestivum TaxID=4565 RepID=UPI001D001DBC|nr:very-long-chain (3R)-3-hydroxyacyl-CoA dehydratase PASTICCINO 2B-like isoform X1 [Triticum aestivum]
MATTVSGSALRRLYLSAYNWVVFFGWAQVLCYAASALLESGHEAVYAAVERPLQFAQTAAFMEILHSILGFVKSPISTTLPQITGRLYITWGILWSFQEAQSHVLVTSLIISWSITEVIRYFFFAMKETFGFAPYWLLWLRYSTFLVFYPTGMLSEAGLILVAMPFMKVTQINNYRWKWFHVVHLNSLVCYICSDIWGLPQTSRKYYLMMPNKWNFSIDYRHELALDTALIIPGFPYLFRYMVDKRKKVLLAAKTV